MTVSDLLEQAKALSPAERKELTKRLIDMIDILPALHQDEPEEHWGKSLNKLLDEIGPIEMMYPEIEDPVEWVKHLRAEQRRHRLGDWGSGE
ncbi:MAG: hypothetical protein CL610_06410 [Anaerolineaceae bacterium]|nr:hypothetical protein [Anaerolineaceae bacterium]